MNTLSVAVVLLFTYTVDNMAEQLVGGFRDINVDDAKVQAMASRAMAHINARRDGIFYMVKLKVLSAKEQIVAGTNTVIEILAQESTCETNKMAVHDVTDHTCSPRNGGMKEVIFTGKTVNE
ncbi:unnamed protein product [Enterobius vermicularis]|uniref:Cystatin domain-containing protein n=1 Tax=Enterobius vermicularis TaxID=51028 RepID=A0A0N4V8Z8_ENTVE|nr:unnamed protein product [Enterobius vermicularis]